MLANSGIKTKRSLGWKCGRHNMIEFAAYDW